MTTSKELYVAVKRLQDIAAGELDQIVVDAMRRAISETVCKAADQQLWEIRQIAK